MTRRGPKVPAESIICTSLRIVSFSEVGRVVGQGLRFRVMGARSGANTVESCACSSFIPGPCPCMEAASNMLNLKLKTNGKITHEQPQKFGAYDTYITRVLLSWLLLPKSASDQKIVSPSALNLNSATPGPTPQLQPEAYTLLSNPNILQ